MVEAANKHIHVPNCPFCNLISKNSPFVIEKAEKISLLLSLEGHPLVVPNDHISPLGIDLELSKALGLVTYSRYLGMVKGFFQADGVHIITNVGVAAGQEVEHLHTHLIPRFLADKTKGFPRLTVKPNNQRLEIARNLRDYIKSNG